MDSFVYSEGSLVVSVFTESLKVYFRKAFCHPSSWALGLILGFISRAGQTFSSEISPAYTQKLLVWAAGPRDIGSNLLPWIDSLNNFLCCTHSLSSKLTVSPGCSFPHIHRLLQLSPHNITYTLSCIELRQNTYIYLLEIISCFQ